MERNYLATGNCLSSGMSSKARSRNEIAAQDIPKRRIDQHEIAMSAVVRRNKAVPPRREWPHLMVDGLAENFLMNRAETCAVKKALENKSEVAEVLIATMAVLSYKARQDNK